MARAHFAACLLAALAVSAGALESRRTAAVPLDRRRHAARALALRGGASKAKKSKGAAKALDPTGTPAVVKLLRPVNALCDKYDAAVESNPMLGFVGQMALTFGSMRAINTALDKTEKSKATVIARLLYVGFLVLHQGLLSYIESLVVAKDDDTPLTLPGNPMLAAPRSRPTAATPAASPAPSSTSSRPRRRRPAMSAMKDRVAALCEQLGVEQSGSGLAPAVRLCAAAAGMTYETIVKTVEALELEVFGVAPVAVVAPPAEGRSASAEPRRRRCASQRRRGRDTRRRAAREGRRLRAHESPVARGARAESMEKAKKDGAVQDIDDDEDEPAPKAPPAKKQRLVPGPGGCTCKILAAGGNAGLQGRPPHECLCKGDADRARAGRRAARAPARRSSPPATTRGPARPRP
ncbi:hypothetical protein JL722_14829 [Aureococcus anophagefferens]|nr:hypothetical protein JL722_14829 [Aureococcus anophagefferens]